MYVFVQYIVYVTSGFWQGTAGTPNHLYGWAGDDKRVPRFQNVHIQYRYVLNTHPQRQKNEVHR